MATTVRQLYKNGTLLYRMKLLAGYQGLTNLVQWVHIVEDNEVADFLHGQELIFTAGIMNRGEDWLLEFAKNLHANQCSAFVVNLGPYTESVDQEVLDFCDEVALPLFTIPWEVHMVDMTRDFCHRIMQNEQVEAGMSTLVKNIIFNIGNMEEQLQQLERYGFRRDNQYTIVAINIFCENEAEQQKRMDEVRFYAERAAAHLHDYYLSFTYEMNYFLVLLDFKQEDIERFTSQFETMNKHAIGWQCCLGIGPSVWGMENLSKHFDKALGALQMAMGQDTKIVYYDKLGFYRILLEVKDRSVLREFFQETLGMLVQYDQENNTEYVKFLETYMKHSGSAGQVAAELYVHRNTVNYQMKKVETITGLDLNNVEERTKVNVAFYIRNLIERI